MKFHRRFRRQDVRNGDPNTLCSGGIIPKLLFCLDVSGSCDQFCLLLQRYIQQKKNKALL